VAHDCHNIIVVGVDDASMAAAVNHIIDAKGGISVAISPQEVHCLPLPVAGLMTHEDGHQTARQYSLLDKQAKKVLGSHLSAPFMTLSFMALLVIPSLKLSDKGLFDGRKFTFTDPLVS
jgi:adenine deaminase